MIRLVLVFVVVLLVAGIAPAKEKHRTSNVRKTSSVSKKADPNTVVVKSVEVKKATMSEEEIKTSLAQIEKAKQENVGIHLEYMKQLYSLRALAIKEHASETQNAIDELIAKERGRFGESEAKEPKVKGKGKGDRR